MLLRNSSQPVNKIVVTEEGNSMLRLELVEGNLGQLEPKFGAVRTKSEMQNLLMLREKIQQVANSGILSKVKGRNLFKIGEIRTLYQSGEKNPIIRDTASQSALKSTKTTQASAPAKPIHEALDWKIEKQGGGIQYKSPKQYYHSVTILIGKIECLYPGEEYQIRPYPPLQVDLLVRKQQEQLARTVQAQQINKQRMEELERRQRMVMESQSIAAQKNLWSFGKHEIPQLAGGHRAAHSASTQLPPQEPSESNKNPLIKKPGVFNMFNQIDGGRNPRDEENAVRGDSPRTGSRPTDRGRAAEDQPVPRYFGEEETADRRSGHRGSRLSPQAGRVPSPERPDADTLQQMRLVAQQNKALQDEIMRVKKLNEVKAQAHKYADEVQRLNQLEAKMYDYSKHLAGVKQLNRVGDELNKQARSQALAAIKQGIVRKEARERELLRPLLEAGNKKKQMAQDPWARQMIEMMMAANGSLPSKFIQQYQDGSDSDENGDEQGSKKNRKKPRGQKKNKQDRDLEKEKEKLKKENEEKLKKMNDEIERLKKESSEAIKETPIGREEIGKLIAEAFEKNREAVHRKLNPVF